MSQLTEMNIIELSDYTLASEGTGNGLNGFYFALSKGDVCSIETNSLDDAHTLLRALATLKNPVKGIYRFMGEEIDFSDYRNLLPYKKKIGYIASDSGMISNRTIRENLLFMRYYFENSLSINLDKNTEGLCRAFDIHDELDMRPAALHHLNLRLAITIREITKSPDMLLLDRPEDFVGHTKFNIFIDNFKKLLATGLAVVILSYDRDFVDTFSNKKILITDGYLTTVPSQPVQTGLKD